jgi:lipopolysaccharide transport system ATP-binding protein
MSSEVAIRVRGLGKAYPVFDKPYERLAQLVLPKGKGRGEFQALSDVSFDVRRGEAVGIIGRNGSGKSTLLQVVCGTLQASAGSVEVHGRVAALLELGAGFNVEFTGLENVFLNGSILGLTRQQVEDRLEDILAFAEIGDHVHQPVKTYSSGMFVRLAFAVAAHCDPEILIVDEALAVGDVYFQRKCYRRIEELRERGCTLLLVTHSTGTLVQMCDRGILLEGGRVLFDGDCGDAVREYMKCLFGTHLGAGSDAAEVARTDARALSDDGDDDGDVGDGGARQGEHVDAVDHASGAVEDVPDPVVAERAALLAGGTLDLFATRAGYNRGETRLGDGRALLADFIIGSASGRGPVVPARAPFRVHARYVFRESIDRLIFGMHLRTVDGLQVYSSNTSMANQGLFSCEAGQVQLVSFNLRCALLPGQYFLGLGVSRYLEGGNEIVAIDRRVDSIVLTVLGPQGEATGYADMECAIDIGDVSAGAAA